MAHELRTPLHSVREGVSVMLEGLTGDLNEDQKDILLSTKSSLDRLVRLVNNVLDFQRLEAGVIQFQFGSYALDGIVREASESIGWQVKDKDILFDLNLEAGLPKVKCDRDRILQVLTNLLNNAIRFTEKGENNDYGVAGPR